MCKIKISIIIPHFNTPEMLSRLLDSVPDSDCIQIIVVDDNSTKYQDELRLLKEKEKKVEFYKNDSGRNSAGTCRNIGLDHAEGEWLLFADADDFFTDGWEKKVEPYLTSNYQIVFFRPVSRDEDIGCEGTRHLIYSEKVDAYMENPSHENELLLRYAFPVPWSKLIRKSFVANHGIRFESTRVSNDEWFSLMCGYYAEYFTCSAETIYCVTTHSGSLTTTPSDANYKIRQSVYIHKLGFLFKHLTAAEIHAIGLDYMPLYLLYDAIMKGFGFKYVVANIKEMRKLQVPLANWKYIRSGDLGFRLVSSLKQRL